VGQEEKISLSIYETYVHSPEPPLNCPIAAVGGAQDPRVTHERLVEWRAQTTAPSTMQIPPGNHFFLHSRQELLLQELRRTLQQLANSASQGPGGRE